MRLTRRQRNIILHPISYRRHMRKIAYLRKVDPDRFPDLRGREVLS